MSDDARAVLALIYLGGERTNLTSQYAWLWNDESANLGNNVAHMAHWMLLKTPDGALERIPLCGARYGGNSVPPEPHPSQEELVRLLCPECVQLYLKEGEQDA